MQSASSRVSAGTAGRVGVAIKSANGFITVRSDPPHEEQFNAAWSSSCPRLPRPPRARPRARAATRGDRAADGDGG